MQKTRLSNSYKHVQMLLLTGTERDLLVIREHV